MIYIVIGNMIALIGAILMTYTGILKNKKKIIFVQTIQIGMFVLSNLVLGGISGAITNTISFFRNILCYKDRLNTTNKFVISSITIILVVLFNNNSYIGYLPLISTISYLWLMDIKDVLKFKYLIIFTLLLWGTYDVFIKSYTSAAFDFASIIFNVISIFQIKSKGAINHG